MPIGEPADVLLFRGSEDHRSPSYSADSITATTSSGHLETDGVYGPPTEAALRLGILPRGQLRRVADNEPG